MITMQTFQKAHSRALSSNQNYSSELSRVFAAAVVNRQFCEMLLQNPQQAIQNGYFGEPFLLSMEEQDLIVSIRARSLSDLATQVNRALQS